MSLALVGVGLVTIVLLQFFRFRPMHNHGPLVAVSSHWCFVEPFVVGVFGMTLVGVTAVEQWVDDDMNRFDLWRSSGSEPGRDRRHGDASEG